MANERTQEFREKLAEMFAHALEEKGLEWKKGWQGPGRHYNAVRGNQYHGINYFALAMTAMERGYQDPRWATFLQIQKQGWKLSNAKGQGVKVEYWFPYDRIKNRNISWEEFRQEGGAFDGRYVPRAVYKTVFNGTLIQGLPELREPPRREAILDDVVQRISQNMKVPILHDGGDRAYYRLDTDDIHLPKPESFFTDYGYHATALHELAHATGAAHRLERKMGGEFGSEEYAYEELVAEISSCFFGAGLSIPQREEDINNHKAYVSSWIRHIKEKPEALAGAIRQAEKAAAYMEFQAGLLPSHDYEKLSRSAMDEKAADKEANMESKEKQEPGGIPLHLKEKGWEVKAAQGEQSLLYKGTEIMRGGQEAIQQAAERIRQAQDNGEGLGKALRQLRDAQGIGLREMARALAIPQGELEAIEAGDIYPDSQALQTASNLFKVYARELEEGRIIPKKTQEELYAALQGIQRGLEGIGMDTKFFREFMEKHRIPSALSQEEGYYVVEDTAIGETVKDASGREKRWLQEEGAALEAGRLNEGTPAHMAKRIIEDYESSIGRRESRAHTYSDEQLVTYAALCQRYLEFGKAVERALQREIPQREAVLVCDTPGLFVQAGCRSLPMHMTQKHLRDCLHEKDEKNPHFHGLTKEEIKRLPEELENPAVIAGSLTREDSLVAILGYREGSNLPVMVSIVPDGQATYHLEAVSSNFITSMFGRDNVGGFIERLAEAGKILFIDKEKSEELALLPLQLRQGHLVPAFDTIIRRIDSDVNRGGAYGPGEGAESLALAGRPGPLETEHGHAGRRKEAHEGHLNARPEKLSGEHAPGYKKGAFPEQGIKQGGFKL